ncbi:(S)-benzoin forming benzil reductase [Alkalihalobacillus pseudalcaliphilus]|uniref:(S)-benzoin forming benzil reductase n=1 Tax=Alkalihalobacillus pseudalcaliphilus TaxID=79884 RepID=UPI00064D87A4|nr:(S)-benzoin forming benzil reductase [Alkalihalobacillus pseudalcaliphilus]KMK74956.1 short-chain dehydrogenase [Alkalihalobacillus pseudalcaliphilus]
MNYAIITGGSKGLGSAIVKELLQEPVHIFSVARSHNEEIALTTEANDTTFENISFDLSDINSIPEVVSSIFQKINLERAHRIFLINNAGVISPIKPLQNAEATDISTNISINLTAPLIFSSCFIKHTEKYKLDKRIINISSGASRSPISGWSSYGSAKAGVNLFSQTVAIEQKQQPFPVQVCAFAPGIIDTGMQEQIRSTDKTDFSELARFQAYKAEGHLMSAEKVAKVIRELLFSDQFPNGEVVSIQQYT